MELCAGAHKGVGQWSPLARGRGLELCAGAHKGAGSRKSYKPEEVVAKLRQVECSDVAK